MTDENETENEKPRENEKHGLTLAILREKAGMTRAEVAERMAIPTTAADVRVIESMYPNTISGVFETYMAALGVKITYTLEGVGEWSSTEVVFEGIELSLRARRRGTRRCREGGSEESS
ncbi:helix-turn-helix domain-containing protein [Streptomyces sp. NPDC057757]|uniref:helix-turn-helix domain-containing protein n=1 Tax=Streptomyces sp. NPDC057757 TaxID=3346241 RepID=UPI00368D1AC8